MVVSPIRMVLGTVASAMVAFTPPAALVWTWAGVTIVCVAAAYVSVRDWWRHGR